MTMFSKFDFKKHGEVKSKDLDRGFSDEKDFFFKRMEKKKGDSGIVLDLYIPKTRTLYKSMVFDNLGTVKNCVVLKLNEKKTIKNGFTPPDKIEDGPVFLEAELTSQPCSIKDKKFVIYEEDLKNLADISNQPLVDTSWTTAGKTGIACPYCRGYYYLDPARPHLCLCPYCGLTKAEAHAEIDRINAKYGLSEEEADDHYEGSGWYDGLGY